MKKNSLLIIALVVIVILGVFCFYPKNSKKADTNTVNIGDNNSFTVLGTFLSKNLSNLATTNPIIKAIMIPP